MKKSYAREVAGAMLVLVVILLLQLFFNSDPAHITALTPIFNGFCMPVGLMCLGLFGVRSWQNNAPPKPPPAS